MNPALTQIIDHPEFGRIMLQAVAFAALGTNEKTVNALRKGGKLVEGEDLGFFYAKVRKATWRKANIQSCFRSSRIRSGGK